MLLDLKRGDEGRIGVIDSFAAGGGFFPIGRIAEIVDPPGKCAALCGTGVVDGALIIFQENAVVRAGAIEEGILLFDLAAIGFKEVLRGELEVVG